MQRVLRRAQYIVAVATPTQHETEMQLVLVAVELYYMM